MVDTPATQSVPDPRPAATIIVVRTGDTGRLEFLLVQRSATSRFIPNFVVFPGGVVDDDDRTLAAEWFGAEEEAARACALRELAEEAGLVLTRDGLVEAPGRLPGQTGFPPPHPHVVPEIARWVAPDFLPVRFDARFFAVQAGVDVEPHADGVEAARAWWGEAGDVLHAAQAGDARLMWPTLKTLEALAACSSVADVLALRMEQVPPPVPSS